MIYLKKGLTTMKITKLLINGKISIFILLVFLSFILVQLEIPITLGITINFASITLLIITVLYGLRYALPTIILINFIIIIFSHIPILSIFQIIEVLVIGSIISKWRFINVFVGNLLFWLIVGPVLFLICDYFSFYGLTSDTLLFYLIILITNGLLNSLIADILVTYIPFNKWLKQNPEYVYTVNTYQILFHLVTVAVAIPFLISVCFQIINVYERMQYTSSQLAISSTRNIEEELNKWDDNDIQRLKLNGVIQIGYLKDLVTIHTLDNAFEIIVANKSNHVLATSMQPDFFKSKHEIQQRNDSFYELIPKNETTNPLQLANWSTGFLVHEHENKSTNLFIHILFPIQDFQQQIFKGLIQQYRFILFFAVVSILLAIAINQLFVRTLAKLSASTSGLPEKIEKMEYINWPTTFILELKTLIGNFRDMSSKLNNKFQEIKIMNEKLEENSEELKKSKADLYDLAYYDPLTKLPNRLHFQQYLSDLITKSEKQKEKFAVLFLDLNRFKQVNDTLGHEAGDKLLKIISTRLQSLVNPTIKIFRLGGDEFVVVINSIDNLSIRADSDRLLSIFNDPVILNGQTLYISGSVGASIYPVNGDNIDTLVKNADMAMYNSKEDGGKHVKFFKKQMEEEITEKMLIDHGLHEAIKNNQFELYYQPKIEANTEDISGMEALIRWNHPDLGVILPHSFIPLAEELGTIFDIDKWSIFEACRQNKLWQDEGHKCIPVSVNISAKHFSQANFISTLKETLKKTGLESKYLKLEITEGVFIRNPETVIDKISEISNLGIAVSIDDFGIGYSSLNHLLNLPIQEIKLDRTFVQNINGDEKKETLVNLILSMAKNLKLNVVAEGVETKAELNLLKHYKCNELQGYYYSKPLNKEDFIQFLINNNTSEHERF